jgi:hypothetical protein
MRPSARLLFTTIALAAATSLAPSARAQDMDACIAASESATTARRAGKLLEARTAFSTCSSSSCPDVVKSGCQQRLAEIRQAVPSIVFQVKDAAGNDLANVKVRMDGKPQEGGVTTAIELDPGPHAFSFEAVGQSTTQKTFTIVEGARERREVITMGTAAPPPPPVPSSIPSAAPSSAPTTGSGEELHPAEPRPGGGWTTMRTVGVVTGGVGIAGVAAGAVFGLLASSAWNNAQSECPGNTLATCPNHAGAVNDHSTTVTDATISTVGFIAGGALVAGGVTLFVLGASPSPEAAQPATGRVIVTPVFGPSVAGLSLAGGF